VVNITDAAGEVQTVVYIGVHEELSQQDAQAACESQHQGALATFNSMHAFDSTMRAILSTEVFHGLYLASNPYMWIGDSAMHGERTGSAPGERRNIPAMGNFWTDQDTFLANNCTSISAATLLFAVGNCSQKLPFVCMSIEGTSPGTSPGSSPGSSPGTIHDDKASVPLPVIIGSIGAVVLLASIVCTWVYYRCWGSGRGSLCFHSKDTAAVNRDGGFSQPRSPIRKSDCGPGHHIELRVCNESSGTSSANTMNCLYDAHNAQLSESQAHFSPNAPMVVRVEESCDNSMEELEDGRVNRRWTEVTLTQNEFYNMTLSPKSQCEHAHTPATEGTNTSGSECDVSKLLHGYTIVSSIGTGAHGTCITLREDHTANIYVAKLPIFADVQSLVKEAYILHQLKHPNVIALKETVIKEDHLILIMEYAKYGDLLHICKEQRSFPAEFNEHLAMHVLYQMALALSYVHQNLISHRDVKPANIVMSDDGIFKLIDFGVSRVLVGTSTTFAGTPTHMAPEILEGQPYSRESDIWSLGSVIYWICTGEDVRPSNSKGDLEHDIATLKDIALRNLHTTRSSFQKKELHDLVVQMLDSDPLVRPSAYKICCVDWLKRFCIDKHEDFRAQIGRIQTTD